LAGDCRRREPGTREKDIDEALPNVLILDGREDLLKLIGDKQNPLARVVHPTFTEHISPLRTDSLPLVSKIYWRENADDAIMDGP